MVLATFFHYMNELVTQYNQRMCGQTCPFFLRVFPVSMILSNHLHHYTEQHKHSPNTKALIEMSLSMHSRVITYLRKTSKSKLK